LIIVAVTSVAKDIPMVKEIGISVPYKEFSVIEFPFKVKDFSFTPFKYMQKKKVGSKKDVDPTYAVPSLNNKTSAKAKVAERLKKRLALKKAKASSPINVVRGVNFFRLYPKKVGNTELIVWGYKDYPVMIELHVTKDVEKADKLIKFIDPQIDIKNANTFESAYHDKVVIAITKALYNNALPRGYKENTVKKEFYSNGLHIVLTKQFLGKRYMGEEYIVENQDSKTIILDSEMFEKNGIYGVTFINNVLTPGKSTKLFIVREKV
jgi:hypothetical protein